VPVVEKFPTSTSVIVGGWNNPTNAYAVDNAVTDSSTDFAEQEYSDFGFNLNATDNVEAVFLNVWASMAIEVWVPDTQESVLFSLRVYNGSIWYDFAVFNGDLQESSGTVGATGGYGNPSWKLSFDVSDYIDAVSQVNALKVRLLTAVLIGVSSFTVGVDAVSVEVASTTPTTTESEFPVGLGAGALLMGLVAVIAFSIKKRR